MFVILQDPQICVDLGSGLNHCLKKYIYTNNRETLSYFNIGLFMGGRPMMEQVCGGQR